MALQSFTGLRPSFVPYALTEQQFSQRGPRVQVRQVTASRGALLVEANRKGNKKTKAVLLEPVKGLGTKGDLVNVHNGYMTNFLEPQRLAKPATIGLLRNLEQEKARIAAAKAEKKAKAKAMATALATIGTFRVAKKVGENDAIFGSVQASELTEAIKMQTGRDLDARDITLPEIKTLGTYEATIKLHPEVTGTFKIKVEKLREKQGKR